MVIPKPNPPDCFGLFLGQRRIKNNRPLFQNPQRHRHNQLLRPYLQPLNRLHPHPVTIVAHPLHRLAESDILPTRPRLHDPSQSSWNDHIPSRQLLPFIPVLCGQLLQTGRKLMLDVRMRPEIQRGQLLWRPPQLLFRPGKGFPQRHIPRQLLRRRICHPQSLAKPLFDPLLLFWPNSGTTCVVHRIFFIIKRHRADPLPLRLFRHRISGNSMNPARPHIHRAFALPIRSRPHPPSHSLPRFQNRHAPALLAQVISRHQTRNAGPDNDAIGRARGPSSTRQKKGSHRSTAQLQKRPPLQPSHDVSFMVFFTGPPSPQRPSTPSAD